MPSFRPSPAVVLPALVLAGVLGLGGCGRAEALALVAAVTLSLLAAPARSGVAGEGTAPTPGALARGEYLATVLGCQDCHTPAKIGPGRRRSRRDELALSAQAGKGGAGAPGGENGRRSRPGSSAMAEFTVGTFVGSLARASINRKLARALIRLAPKALEFVEIRFDQLPLYSYDYDDDFPAVARRFKEAIAGVDALMFVTPEYNRSIPGGLKNAIDWASRPYGQNSFTHKPSAVIGTSPGSIGTAIAQQHLRSLLGFCNSPQMNAPEAYIQFHDGMITDEGEVTSECTREFLEKWIHEFHAFVVRVTTVLPPQRNAGSRDQAPPAH